MTDALPVLCDLFDPSRSSEFAVPNRILQSLARRKNVRISTFLRQNNDLAISAWIAQSGLSHRVSYDLYPFHFAKADGSHKSRIHLVCDITIKQIAFLRENSQQKIIAKIGMVHFIFNIIPLLLRNGRIFIGPVSGFEIFPLGQAWRYLSWRKALYYFAFNILTFCMRLVFKIAVRLRKGAVIMCATAADRRYLLKNNMEAQNRIHVVSEVTPPASNLMAYSDRTHIVWSGAMIERKAPLLALEALAAALQERRLANATMLGEGPLLPLLRDAHSTLPADVRDRIIIAGGVSLNASQRTIASAGMLLVTSWREVNSFVVYEALAHGVPVVAMPLSGMRDLVGRFGRLIAFGASIPATMADAILDVLDNWDMYRARASEAVEYLPRKDSEDIASVWSAIGLD